MISFQNFLEKKIEDLDKSLLLRDLHPDHTPLSPPYVLRNERKLISFSGNDYLGLSYHPSLQEAALEALKTYGTGAGASRLVTGNHPLYRALESTLASYAGTENAAVFGSGYLANLGIIQSLIDKTDIVIADKLIHASLLDGIRLSGAKLYRFSHNNPAACEQLLKKHRAHYRHALIVTERVFSMDGDVAPLETLHELAKTYDSVLLVDDAHGLGVLPSSTYAADIRIGTLSKAAGSYGGYVCGSNQLIRYLHSAARSFIFSTALPPSVVAASLAALHIIQRDDELTKKPLELAGYFTSLLGLPPAQSAIVPLILGTPEKALAASKFLEEAGFLVTAIRPPTVPPGTARLRFTFSACHDKEAISRLAAIIKEKVL